MSFSIYIIAKSHDFCCPIEFLFLVSEYNFIVLLRTENDRSTDVMKIGIDKYIF